MKKLFKRNFQLILESSIGIFFIFLKIHGFVEWPWTWVLSPFWIDWAMLLLILILCLVMSTLAFIDRLLQND